MDWNEEIEKYRRWKRRNSNVGIGHLNLVSIFYSSVDRKARKRVGIEKKVQHDTREVIYETRTLLLRCSFSFNISPSNL